MVAVTVMRKKGAVMKMEGEGEGTGVRRQERGHWTSSWSHNSEREDEYVPQIYRHYNNRTSLPIFSVISMWRYVHAYTCTCTIRLSACN